MTGLGRAHGTTDVPLCRTGRRGQRPSPRVHTYAAGIMKRFGVTAYLMCLHPPPRAMSYLGPKRGDAPGGNWLGREVVGGICGSRLSRGQTSPTPFVRWLVKHTRRRNVTGGGEEDSRVPDRDGAPWGGCLWTQVSFADKATGRRSVTGVAVTARETAVTAFKGRYLAAAEGVKEALFVRAVLAFVAPETSDASILVREDKRALRVGSTSTYGTSS